MIMPRFEIDDLPDGSYLITISQEGEPSTQFTLHPHSALLFGQFLVSKSLGRKMEVAHLIEPKLQIVP